MTLSKQGATIPPKIPKDVPTPNAMPPPLPTKKQATANRVTGAGKAKRSARLASKRGLSNSNKPSPMEVERETYRLNRSQRGGNAGNANKRNNKTVADQKVKAKNKKAAANNNKSNGNKNVPKKAVNIALQAMRDAGYNYDVPKGSKMVISFAPSSTTPSKSASQKKNTSNNNNNNNRGRNNNRGARR